MIKSLIKNAPRCLKHLEPLVVLAFLGLLALCEANKEVATNSFYVKINGKDGAEAAHKIARRNGFHNLGPVSLSFFMRRYTLLSTTSYQQPRG